MNLWWRIIRHVDGQKLQTWIHQNRKKDRNMDRKWLCEKRWESGRFQIYRIGVTPRVKTFVLLSLSPPAQTIFSIPLEQRPSFNFQTSLQTYHQESQASQLISSYFSCEKQRFVHCFRLNSFKIIMATTEILKDWKTILISTIGFLT